MCSHQHAPAGGGETAVVPSWGKVLWSPCRCHAALQVWGGGEGEGRCRKQQRSEGELCCWYICTVPCDYMCGACRAGVGSGVRMCCVVSACVVCGVLCVASARVVCTCILQCCLENVQSCQCAPHTRRASTTGRRGPSLSLPCRVPVSPTPCRGWYCCRAHPGRARHTPLWDW